MTVVSWLILDILYHRSHNENIYVAIISCNGDFMCVFFSYFSLFICTLHTKFSKIIFQPIKATLHAGAYTGFSQREGVLIDMTTLEPAYPPPPTTEVEFKFSKINKPQLSGGVKGFIAI